uniref:J domain-containing protein n=1 Tax=viral metagenome TaxID=1070528 RepID=A0A6C0CZX8_9ZZZZ
METQNLSYDELLNLYKNQQDIIENQQKTLNKLSNKNNFNPYKILNISKNFELSTLKKAYLNKAIQTHPDKGGNPDVFKNVVLAYKVLLKKHNMENNISDHNSLKNDQKIFNETQESNNSQNLNLNKKFSNSKFNKVFEDNKITDPFDDGHGEWYNSKYDDNKQIFNSKVNSSTFNDAFNREKNKKLLKKKNQIRIREPEEKISYSGADSIVVLGQGRVNNFGGSTGNGLHYYDLKKAYDDNYINDTIETVSNRTINSVKSDRSNLSYNMSDKDLKIYNKNKIKKQEQETQRINNLNNQDDMASRLYDRIHSKLIG